MKEVSFYPGCSLHGTAADYGYSIRGVSTLLDIQLQELEDWTCCGASSAHSVDEKLAVELTARNLVIAGKSDRELLIPCVACYSRFKAAEKEIRENPKAFHTSYQGKTEIRYALDFFCDDSVLDTLKQKRVKSLSGLKTACYYGCLAVRPPKVIGAKNYENPQNMERLMSLLGAEPVDWPYKTDCCGAGLAMTRTDIVRKLVQKILAMAKEAEADCIVVGCPMCQANLDTRQKEIEKETGETYHLPILYFTELMGIALGHKDVKKWLSSHLVDPIKMLKAKGLIK